MSEQPTLPALPIQDVLEFRYVPDFLGYCVGDDGSVWSCRTYVGLGQGKGCRSCFGNWRRLRGSLGTHGYVHYSLRRNGKYVNRFAHQLVLAAFVGSPPAGMECCHNNGVRHDNRLTNLRYDTRQSNHDDQIRHGTRVRGVQRWNAKLDDEKVREIKRLLASRQYIHAEIGEMFGVCAETVRRIAVGEGWSHVA